MSEPGNCMPTPAPSNKLTRAEVHMLAGAPARVVGDYLRGRMLALPNNWGDAEVIGAYRSEDKAAVMLAWPSADKTVNLFGERIEDLTDGRSGS